jgi:hypothetical protein
VPDSWSAKLKQPLSGIWRHLIFDGWHDFSLAASGRASAAFTAIVVAYLLLSSALLHHRLSAKLISASLVDHGNQPCDALALCRQIFFFVIYNTKPVTQ